MGLPGIFEPTIFSPRAVGAPEMARARATTSRFIRAMHPKSEVRPDAASIAKVLALGWVGQLKIHGHRAQIHIPADAGVEPIAYNRHGGIHRKLLPPEIVKELRRLFAPRSGWNAIDAEWLKPEGKLFVFDFIKRDDEILSDLTYPERYALLPRAFISPSISVLPVYKTADRCLEALATPGDHIEGLVFKATRTEGFPDTAIIRCRKRK